MGTVIIPEGYKSCLSTYETQEAIGMIKNLMQKKLCMVLPDVMSLTVHLMRMMQIR